MSSTPLDLRKLMKLPVGMLEMGLNMMGGSVRAIQSTLEGLSGQGSHQRSSRR